MVCDKCFGSANGDCDTCERRKRDIEREKLIEALQVIKDTCDKNNVCEQCPLAESNGNCLVCDNQPCDWKINDDNKVWRALV